MLGATNPSRQETDFVSTGSGRKLRVILANKHQNDPQSTQCKGMLPPSAITKGCAESHPRRRRAVPRFRFGQDDVWFELRRVRFG
jgi:hypothetical protein